jgi:hypothetical protein
MSRNDPINAAEAHRKAELAKDMARLQEAEARKQREIDDPESARLEARDRAIRGALTDAGCDPGHLKDAMALIDKASLPQSAQGLPEAAASVAAALLKHHWYLTRAGCQSSMPRPYGDGYRERRFAYSPPIDPKDVDADLRHVMMRRGRP